MSDQALAVNVWDTEKLPTTFKRSQMEIADANSGLSWTEMYAVVKATFPKVLPFVFIAAFNCLLHFLVYELNVV